MARCSSFSAVAAAILAGAISLAVLQFGPTGERLVMLGTGYVSKVLCSGVFVGRRDMQSVIDRDVTDLLARLLFRSHVDFDKKSVTTSFIFGYYSSQAIYHGQYTGCSVIPDMDNYQATDAAKFESLRKSIEGEGLPDVSEASKIQGPWVRKVNPTIQKLVDAEFSLEAYDTAHTRALVIVHQGQIVGEGYATAHAPDITDTTGLLGWSMSKSMMAILVGMRIRDGYLKLDDVVYKHYTLRNLLNMADILPIPEEYGMAATLPYLLFCQRSMIESIENYSGPHFRTALGTSHWYYSSLVAVIISHVFRQSFDSELAYLRYPRDRLFKAIGGQSFVLETDQTGLFVGSSFSYGTAQDWARLGQLVLNRGVWGGQRLLDEEYVDFLTSPTNASTGIYGGQMWCVSGAALPANASAYLRYEHVTVNYLKSAVPPDTCYFSGHDGQFVVLVPSSHTLVVRLGHTTGMTPPHDPTLLKGWKPTWDVARFLREILDSVNKD